VRNDTRFAAPCAGQDQQRTFGVRNGLALLGIQALQEIHLMGVCLNSIMGAMQHRAKKFDERKHSRSRIPAQGRASGILYSSATMVL